ncbi:MAG TPA: hypothetical protein VHE54_01580, partial [Puia sp.]|nr:hypothetical protein [Puia sp.]
MANLLHRYKSFPLLLAVAVSLAGYRSAMAQDPRADSLSDAFNRYPMRWVQEKLFVHIDKTFYLAGEFIWFKAYDVDSRGNMPLSISGVAYVELLDKDQKPVLQEKIALKNGAGHGSFRIPSSIVPGHYIFRAYTGWMKNFSPDLYYHQSLTILNTLNNEAPDTARQHADAADAGYAIRFFPEGGSLVDGLVSEVGFKATDRSDNGMPCSGVVVDQRKDTVARFTANRFGMGHFTFTPLPGNTYTALVTAAPGKASESLPAALEQGIVLHLEDIDAHRLRVSVHSTAALPDPSLYLFVHTRHHIRSILVNRLAGNQASFLIDKDSLDNGISHITLFTAERTPVCERLYCKQPERRLRIDVKPAGTTGTTGPRSKLTVELSTTDPSGRPLPADLSMSVFLVDPLQPVPEENILSYLLLRSDLRGRIQSPGSYFGDSGRATREALDDLMLTQGWSRFRWDDILHDKKPAFEFLPEPNGPVVHARLVDRTTGRPAAPQTAYLSIPGRRFRLSAALSRADGSVNFDVGKFYGARELILQTNSPAGGDSDIRIDVSGPFSDRFAQPSDDAGAAGALPP